DIQEILDSSTNGVVYFSMGSILKSSDLPAETKRGLLKLLGELPYTVLWKFEEQLKDLPKNLHVKAWMPQAAILALRYGVPLVAVPVFGDQPANAAQAVRSGYAVKVHFDEVQLADNLRPALKEILNNDSYYKQAKYLSFLFNNRPVPPTKLIAHY
ncbi:UDP-glucosyltransferase, partial [Operophtera brumata]